jgi:hypothetical protein
MTMMSNEPNIESPDLHERCSCQHLLAYHGDHGCVVRIDLGLPTVRDCPCRRRVIVTVDPDPLDEVSS